VLGLWFLIQVVEGLPSLALSGGGGVAWFAHIGGFLAGVGLVMLSRLTGRPRRGSGDWHGPTGWVDRNWTD